MNARHLEWLIGEPVPDPEMVVYEVFPYSPADANRVIEHLFALAEHSWPGPDRTDEPCWPQSEPVMRRLR
jgi:hypothetical protein